MTKIADAGLIIAALDQRNAHHAWVRACLEQEPPPWFVCEPVLLEMAVCLGTPEPILEMLRVGDLEISFQLSQHLSQVFSLIKKYPDQGMDLADACVVRRSELYENAVVYTVDKTDFRVYRRHGRQPIPCQFPECSEGAASCGFWRRAARKRFKRC